MRKLALLAAAAACLAAPATAQNNRGRGAAAPAAQLSAEQRSAIGQAVTRGRALYAIDRAAAVTTRDMLVRLPDPAAAGVIGWVAQPQGNAIQVTYYAREGSDYVAVYRAQLLGGRVTSPQVYAGSRPPLDAVAARMAAAREAVAAKNNRVCGGSTFNSLVLPPSAPSDPVLVYQMSPRAARERVPLGGHFLTSVSPDGAAGESINLTGPCANLDVPPVAAGQRPRPLTVTGLSADMPNEMHVFLSLWTERPLAVAANGAPARVWGVTGQGIGELRQ